MYFYYYYFFYESGRGKPIKIRERTKTINGVAETALPKEIDAKNEYETRYTGQLTDEHSFGSDPLCDREDLQIRREERFFERYDIKLLFQSCANGRPQSFKNAILFFIEETAILTQLL